MNILETFVINERALIEVIVPSIENKINYFYPVTAELHQFDEVTACLHYMDKSILLCKNTVDEVFFRLRSFLNKVIKKEFIIIDKTFIGMIGKFHNIDEYRHWKYEEGGDTLSPDALDYLSYFLYSSDEAQTWLYSDGRAIYLEVGHAFPLLSSADAPYDDLLFQSFIDTYQYLYFSSISFAIAQEWIEKCDKQLKLLGIETIPSNIL